MYLMFSRISKLETRHDDFWGENELMAVFGFSNQTSMFLATLEPYPKCHFNVDVALQSIIIAQLTATFEPW